MIIRFTDIPSSQIKYITDCKIRQFSIICSSETCPEGQEVKEIELKTIENKKTEWKRSQPELKLINMESVKVEQIEWLLYPFIPFGKVTIIQGDPGEGKTTMVLQIIAKLTRGEPILLNKKSQKEAQQDSEENLKQEVLSQDNSIQPVNVIYQTAEDGLGDTIKPRLLAAGADCSRVLVIDDREQPLTMLDVRLEEARLKMKSRGYPFP